MDQKEYQIKLTELFVKAENAKSRKKALKVLKKVKKLQDKLSTPSV